jgi:hypothetical protein
MDFKLKYLKYKAKYLKLLEQTGGLNLKQVIFSAGLNHVTDANGNQIRNDTMLYAYIDGVFKPAGTLAEIKNNDTIGTTLVAVKIDGVRRVLGDVVNVRLYYDADLQSVLPPPQQVQQPPQHVQQPPQHVQQHLQVPADVEARFSFITDDNTRQMLTTAFVAVNTIPGGWVSLVPEPERGFMFTRHQNPVLTQVSDAVGNSYPHSGSTHGWVMRQMQGIARLGWDTWSQLYLNSQNIRPNNQASNVPLVDSEPVYCVLEDPEFCPICFEALGSSTHAVSDGTHRGTQEDPISCGHKYHIKCIDEWIKTGRRDCPMCRGPITKLYPNTRK